MAVGCSPTSIVCVARAVARSTRVTVPVEATPRASTTTRSAVAAGPVVVVRSRAVGRRPPQFVTNAVVPAESITAPNGAMPVGARATTTPVFTSTIASESLNVRGTTASLRPFASSRAAKAGAPVAIVPSGAAIVQTVSETPASCTIAGPAGAAPGRGATLAAYVTTGCESTPS